MPVSVMKVTKAEKHPNADSLFVYSMTSIDNFQTQIVANSTNLYEIGDHAIVAQLGSKLKDGTYIEEAKIRGLVSCGMAIGKTDLPLGVDLTDEYCLPVYHVSWPDIELFSTLVKSIKETNTERKLSYVSKVKLHGTNAAIQIHPNGDIICQSRTEILSLTKDYKGFAKWASDNNEYFQKLVGKELVILYGEWCGTGIEKGVALSQIGKKIFAVFAIQYGGMFDINPKTIRNFLPENDNVYVIPFFNSIHLDFANLLDAQIQEMNSWVHQVEMCDPFVKEFFDISGLGEGLVFYPLPDNVDINSEDKILIERSFYKDYVFKAKGEKHKVVKHKDPVQIDPEVAKSIEEFVDLFVTENRLEQIFNKVELKLENTGKFLKLFSEDVLKESTAELDASKLTWKDVSAAVSVKARNWWMEKAKNA
jgi:tRNA-binding EMAP/Myf-like protein